MCRLLAYVAPTRTRIADVISSAQCETFQRMGRLHDDGWGSMWVQDRRSGPGGSRLVRLRDRGSAFGDVRLAHAMREPRSRARAYHLRLATGALPVRTANTHPFLVDGIGLAHNGSILPTDALAAIVEPRFAADVRGDTDSELYLALIRQHLAELRADVAEAPTSDLLPVAVARTVEQLRVAYPTASLNAIVMDASQLLVVHASTTADVPYQHFVASGLAPPELPADHDESYYRIGMLRGADGSVAFSSSGLDRSGWLMLPPDSLTVVGIPGADLPDGVGLDVRIEALGSRVVS